MVSLSTLDSYPSGLKMMFRTILPDKKAKRAVKRLDFYLRQLDLPVLIGPEPDKALSCPNCGGNYNLYNDEED